SQIEGFVRRYALIPAQLGASLDGFPWGAGPDTPGAGLRPILTLVTSLFVHGGVLHVAGNMLYLFIFGAWVEWRLGSLRFQAVFLAAGTAAAVATIATARQSEIPGIGASGAIAGVLGAYFIFYPRGRITTILPVFIFIQVIEVPAVIYLLLWFAVQLYAGLMGGSQGAIAGGVAWWAHVGGFLFGIALGPLLARKEPSRRRVR